MLKNKLVTKLLYFVITNVVFMTRDFIALVYSMLIQIFDLFWLITISAILHLVFESLSGNNIWYKAMQVVFKKKLPN